MKTRTLIHEMERTFGGGWIWKVEEIWGVEARKYMEVAHDWLLKQEGKELEERRVEELKIKKEINEWKKTINSEWSSDRRTDYLENRVSDCDKSIGRLLDKVVDLNKEGTYLIEKRIDEIKKKKKKAKNELKFRYGIGEKGEVTDAMIENAKAYPIEQIIELDGRGFTLCPFHNDKNPSAYCKNNYLYCFSCNEQADTIKLYMHLHDCKFPKAVKALQ